MCVGKEDTGAQRKTTTWGRRRAKCQGLQSFFRTSWNQLCPAGSEGTDSGGSFWIHPDFGSLLSGEFCSSKLSFNSPPQEVFRLKQYGSGALSCVASDGHWVVAGAARSEMKNHKEYLKKHSLTFVLEVFLCGTFTQGTVLELFDKGPSRIWWDFIFSSGKGERKTYLDCTQCQCAGVWLLCTTLQVLDYPYCWALGSGGRGAVWDLSSGKIVNYFGSNDRWPGWFCFDNFSLFWSSGGFGSLTQMVGKYIGTGPDFWLISIQSSQLQVYGSQRGKLQVEEVCKGTIFYFLHCNLICLRCPVHSLRWRWLSWMQKVETWLALYTLNMERILPIKS